MQLTLPQIPEPLRLWEKIEIVVGEGDTKGVYLTRIEDFTDDAIIVCNPEFQQGRTLLRNNCEVVVLVIKEDAVYQFYSQIMKVEKDGQQAHALSLPTEIRRIQRRQFVRIEMFSNIRYANLGSRDFGRKLVWHQSACENISGGGMLICSDDNVEPPDILLIKTDLFAKLHLPQPIAAICRRTLHKENRQYAGIEFIRADSLTHYLYGSELSNLPPSVVEFDHAAQNRLVTFVFQQQIDLRKKGLI